MNFSEEKSSPLQRMAGMGLIALAFAGQAYAGSPKARHHGHPVIRHLTSAMPKTPAPIIRMDPSSARSLTVFNLQTKEELSVTYWQNGQYIDAALNKLDYFMRDFRRNDVKHMNPEAFDIVHDIAQHFGTNKPIGIISGYRDLATQAEIHKRSERAHKNAADVQVAPAGSSQHNFANAIDFTLPGIKASKVYAYASSVEKGGVGFYPVDGFVHVDTDTSEPKGHPRRWIERPDHKSKAKKLTP